MFNYYESYLSVRGGSGGKTFTQAIDNGRVTMTGTDLDGRHFQHIVFYQNGKIAERKFSLNGEMRSHLVYGSYIRKADGTIVRFKKGTKIGRHGKARHFEDLFGHKGVCHSWYSNGRLIRQKYIYDNRITAYEYRARKPFTVKDYNGNILYEITGILVNSYSNMLNGCHSVLDNRMHEWFSETAPFEVKKKGKIIYAGQYANRQRVGKWVEDGVTGFYEHGVLIPKTLYNTPVEKLDPLRILKLQNAQLRMALMSKITPYRIAKCGTVIHKEKDMELFSIKNFDVNILKVKCPTTKSLYYLRVPKDSKKCEEARQWTFGVGEDLEQPIKFAIET